jgi:hypothetical protein
MKHFCALALLLVSVSCCSFKPGCIIQDKVTQVATDAIVANLQCANPAAVKASMVSVLAPLNLCTPNTGPLGDLICPSVAGAAANLIGNAIPSQWQCTGAMAKAALSGALLQACKQIPVGG